MNAGKQDAAEKSLKKIPVLFENDYCLVLNKPAGLPVQGGEGIKVSLDSILSESYSKRPLLVHRLDRDTSGAILVAKTRQAAAGFSALFSAAEKDRQVLKQYLGVCRGIPETGPSKTGVIRLGLDVRGKAKEAETFYRVLSAGSAAGTATGHATGTADGITCALLELRLGTGRMHQIRRHLSRVGLPLFGDDKYGDFSLNKKLRKTCGLKNLLLHASRLVIPPSPGLAPEGIDITAPPPDYFSAFLVSAGIGLRR